MRRQPFVQTFTPNLRGDAQDFPMHDCLATAPARTLLSDLDPATLLAWPTPPDGLTPEDCHDAALEGLIAQAAAADPEGPAHAKRVGRMAAALAAALGHPTERCRLLERAAALHDLGKLALPDAIIGYRHVLDRTRRRIIEQHALFGAAMLAAAREPWLRLARSVALCHHERWDGSGYPAGLVGAAIPLAARLTSVADVYDALRSERPYKLGMSHEDAVARMCEGDDRLSPGHFDPQILAAFATVAPDFAAIHDSLRDAPAPPP